MIPGRHRHQAGLKFIFTGSQQPVQRPSGLEAAGALKALALQPQRLAYGRIQIRHVEQGRFAQLWSNTLLRFKNSGLVRKGWFGHGARSCCSPKQTMVQERLAIKKHRLTGIGCTNTHFA